MNIKSNILKPLVSAAMILVSASPALCGDVINDSIICIRNGDLVLKQDLRRGGSICHISRGLNERNIVNIHDEGRYIQQSYYAGENRDRRHEGQSPNWSPWNWNPIQGGDYAHNGAKIVKYEVMDGKSYVACIPMQWDMNGYPAEALMEQWAEVEGNLIHVRNKITCHRTDTIYGSPVIRDQEIPAVYPISSLKHLYSYFGNKPFEDDNLDRPEVVEIKLGKSGSFWGKYPDVPEKWMAFVDDNKWGIGVYSPMAERFLAGRYSDSTEGEAYSKATSYIAPLCSKALDKNSVFEYDYYLIVDNLDKIRKTIYKLNKELNTTKENELIAQRER